jgi:hypothetical protein
MYSQTMRVILCVAVIAVALAGSLSAQSEKYVALFDGKSLQGWTVLNTGVAGMRRGAPAAEQAVTTPGANPFTVSDGVLRVEGANGWLKSERQYGDFRLRVEVRFVTDNADSGVFIRAVGASIFLRGWPGNSYQIQARDVTRNQTTNPILIGNIYRHGNPGGTTNFDSAAAMQSARKTGEWQTIEIEARGGELTVTLNGVVVTRATSIVNPTGNIGIQAEAGIVEYRSIQVLEL